MKKRTQKPIRNRYTYRTRRRVTVLVAAAAAGAVVLVALGLLNAGYLVRRMSLAFNPPPPIEVPERAVDDETLWSLAGQPDRLLIPSLNIEAPIVRATERSERSYQLALRSGVAHFPGTAEVGEFGNVYLFGHSSDFPLTPGDYKTVFATLPDIESGTAIYASDAAGNVYRYLAAGTDVVRPDDLSVLDQHDKQKRMLTLQTSYPIGTALRRFVVIAELDTEMLVR